MDWKPTAEQQAIVDAATSTRDHLSVVARAGAAKTSTLVLISNAMPNANGLCLAFNVAIKDEMKERLPGNYRAMTLNGLGHYAWGQYLGKKCRLDKAKMYRILRSLIDQLPKHEADEAFEDFAETKRACGLAKIAGYIPRPIPAAFRPLCDEHDFFNIHLPHETTELQRELINEACRISFDEARDGIIDFDDQILCAAVAAVKFEHYSEVMVDEAQDLNAIQHKIIGKLIKPGTRLIAVGDPLQAIYGFRGADTSSMQKMADKFETRELNLTMTFRCAKNIVANAQWRAPDLRAADWAPDGEVLHPDNILLSEIEDDSAIICRNNAPLFRMAIRLLRNGRYPELIGRDVMKAMAAKLKKLGKPKLSKDEALASLRGWYEAEKQKQRDKALVEDVRECMELFIMETDTLGAAIAFVQNLERRSGRIKLMTGHKSKGLEFDTVYFLDPDMIRMENDQDLNLKYVIETRAKTKLVYIRTDSILTEEVE